MDVDSWILGGLLALGLLLAAFAAAAETALASASRFQLREMLAMRQPRAQAGEAQAEALVGQPARYLSTLLVVKLFAFVLVTSVAILLAQHLGYGTLIVWSLVAVIMLLILAQLLPRAWVVGRQERVALWLAPPVHFLALLLQPITAVMNLIGHRAVPAGISPESIYLSEDGLRLLLNMGDDESAIEEEEKEMIASIFEFGETLVREVMVPRIDITAVPVQASMVEALDIILKAGHSRIPVYNESIDNIVGILYAKDLLPYLRDGRTDVPLSKILRPAYFIPESKKVDELLQELQQRKVHMAIVVDEYGGTAGLATIEDLLEEIVGEIQDEYDAEQPTIEAVSEEEYLFDARVVLDEVNKLLHVDLPSEGGDTLGGFIYSQLGRVPVVGDTIDYDGVRIEVLSVAGRRIKQVRANRATPLPEESNYNGAGPVAISFFGLH